jgi:hypothetical protein
VSKADESIAFHHSEPSGTDDIYLVCEALPKELTRLSLISVLCCPPGLHA